MVILAEEATSAPPGTGSVDSPVEEWEAVPAPSNDQSAGGATSA